MQIIYLDMDGVLVNFWGKSCELLQIDKTYNESLSELGFETPKEFWNKMKQFEESEMFWPALEEYTWTQDLLKKVKDSGATWYILTSPSLSEYSSKGKVQKLQQMFGRHFKNYVITKHKHLLAKPNTLLIDDTEEKVDKFIEHGGQAMLFPQSWNRNKHLIDERVEYYTTIINDFVGK